MLGADTDLPALQDLCGPRSVAAVTIGQALHWMRHEELFQAAVPLLRPGGGIAVVTNGTQLWLQDSARSRGLREFLDRTVIDLNRGRFRPTIKDGQVTARLASPAARPAISL